MHSPNLLSTIKPELGSCTTDADRLSVAADDEIVFTSDHDGKWHKAPAKLGIDLSMLSTNAGHA
jgi:putative AlgH/UPF0301 family transcriptional regulator